MSAVKRYTAANFAACEAAGWARVWRAVGQIGAMLWLLAVVVFVALRDVGGRWMPGLLGVSLMPASVTAVAVVRWRELTRRAAKAQGEAAAALADEAEEGAEHGHAS